MGANASAPFSGVTKVREVLMRLRVSEINKISEIDGIDVEVVRKDIRNMYLRVKPPEGRVVVSAPYFVSNQTIERFVASKANWIRKRRALLQEQQQNCENDPSGSAATGETLLLWGKRYRVTRAEGARFALEIADTPHDTFAGIATFTVRAGSTPEQREAWLREWYRAQLCVALEQILPVWEERTGLRPAEWRTKYMKTRWGTCNTKARRVWFNVRLAKYPPECLDYVVLHELAHLKEPSHNADFWAIVSAHMPAWRRVRTLLNSQPYDR